MTIARLENYSTAGLAPAEGIAYWNRLMRDTFKSTAVSAPFDRNTFFAELVRLKLGELQFAETCAPPTVVCHVDPRRGRSRNLYVLQLQLEGTSVKRQCGREAHLSPGDFTICDGDGTWRFDSESHSPLLTSRRIFMNPISAPRQSLTPCA